MTRTRASTRQQIFVLIALSLAAAVGIVLVVTGRTPAEKPPSVTVTSPKLRSIGAVRDVEVARKTVAALDPTTLRAPDSTNATVPPTSTTIAATAKSRPGQPTEADRDRCVRTTQQQSSDRTLGKGLASAAMEISSSWALVLSFAMPASGNDPAGNRIIVSDAASCRVLFAING